MGLLTVGEPLSWKETQALSNHVRKNGIKQFIKLYKRLEHRQKDSLKWGDEVEFVCVKLDNESQRATLCLKADRLLSQLTLPEMNHSSDKPPLRALWRPEYANYMVEGTPGEPYGWSVEDLGTVESNMRERRHTIELLLDSDEIVVTMSTFPRLGCPNFTTPSALPFPSTSISRSIFWPDEAIFNAHPRFATLTRNIRQRRGCKVLINVPVFKDSNTRHPLEDFDNIGSASQILEDHIYMDAMGFGMGLSCLQLTFQATDLPEAERLYDELAVLCPILMALTAASPIFRGFLSDVDCRWNIISNSVDDRSFFERDCDSAVFIPKSRYASISSYLSSEAQLYNDIEFAYDKDSYATLIQNEIPEPMSKHIAHLFIRDSVSLFESKVKLDENYSDDDTDHFENIQSTNWQTMRFKPPPPSSNIGWRVEFRPCELQFTDFENAAICSFVVLLTRALLTYKQSLLMPISMVDENIQRAQCRDAIVDQRFWFRHGFEPTFKELSLNDIMNGKNGLLALVENFVEDIGAEAHTLCAFSKYCQLLKARASGKCVTNATFMRKFVLKHPDYKQDSIVSEKINYDLLVRIRDIQRQSEKKNVCMLNIYEDKLPQ